jgi:hypothetical protein
LLEACLTLGVMRGAIALLPFKRIVAGSPSAPEAKAPPVSAADLAQAVRIGRIVGRAARHTPWCSTCLAQGLATQWMLRRRGVGNALVLGARRDTRAGHQLAAHAWVICGDRVVAGEAGHSNYRALAKFIV